MDLTKEARKPLCKGCHNADICTRREETEKFLEDNKETLSMKTPPNVWIIAQCMYFIPQIPMYPPYSDDSSEVVL